MSLQPPRGFVNRGLLLEGITGFYPMSLVFLCNRTGPSPFLRDGHFIRQLKSNPSKVLKAAEADALALVTSF